MSYRTVHIERKPRDPGPAAEPLRERLLAADRVELTPADACALSGLPLDLAEPALLELAGRYPSRIRVTEQGDLLFRFESLTRPRDRDPHPLTLAGRAIARFLARHRDGFFALVTLVLGPAALVLAAGNAWSAVDAIPAGALQIMLGVPVFLLSFFMMAAGVVAFTMLQVFPLTGLVMVVLGVVAPVAMFMEDPEADQMIIALVIGAVMLGVGVPLTRVSFKQLAELIGRGGNAWAPSLWRAFGGFVFGPLRGPRDPDALADERALTALIRRREGVLTRADLMSLFGWSWDVADREVTRVMVDYGGDVVVTDDGEMLFVFDDIMRTAGEAGSTGADVDWARARLGGAPRFFGCGPWTAGIVLATSLLALVGLAAHPELALTPTADDWRRLADIPGERMPPPLLMQGVGAWPYLVLLGVPSLRLPWWVWRRVGWRGCVREIESAEAFLAVDRACAEERTAADRYRAERRAAAPDVWGPIVFDTADTG